MYSNKKSTKHGLNVFISEDCANVDFKYGPYSSVQEAFDYLDDLEVTAVGLTVGIKTANGIEEYWFKKNCNSVNDLVKKDDNTIYTIKGDDLV